MANEKYPKEASNIFHSIMTASVTIKDAEKITKDKAKKVESKKPKK